MRALKHDLGKYITFQTRWLGADPTGPELVQAVLADVLSTRRGPNGSESAMAIWKRYRAALLGDHSADGRTANLGSDRAVGVIDDRIKKLEGLMPMVRDGDVGAAGEAALHARVISAACRDLLTRVRAGGR